MANDECTVQIPDLPLATGLDPNAEVIIAQAGSVYKTTLSALAGLLAKRSVVSTAVDYTITINDGTVVCTAPVTVFLPTAVDAEGCEFNIKRFTTAGNVLIQPNGVETIDGYDSITINVNLTDVNVRSDGSNWIRSS